jgi:PII-like signaling protein
MRRSLAQQLRTLQISTFGSDGQDGIALGIRSFPVHKLVMICFDSDKNKAEEFSKRIRSVLGLPVTINLVTKENVIRDTMERVNEVLNINAKEFQQVLMNISSGDKLLGCAAL